MTLPSPPNLFPALSKFRVKGQFCDVRIKLHSCYLYAHRIILAASSSYFQVESENESKVTKVSVPKEVDDVSMTFIINWMYNEDPELDLAHHLNSTNVSSKQILLNLKHASQKLGINDLVNFFSAVLAKAEINSTSEPGAREKIAYEENEPGSINSDKLSKPCSVSLIDISKKQVVLNVKCEASSSDPETLDTEDGDLPSGSEQSIDNSVRDASQSQESDSVNKNNSDNFKKVSAFYDTPHKYVKMKDKKLRRFPRLKKRRMVKSKLEHLNDPVLKPLIKDSTFICKDCNFQIVKSRYSNFEVSCAQHLYYHHNIFCPDICLRCPIENCKKVFFNKYTLSFHVKTCEGPKLVPGTNEIRKNEHNDPVLLPHIIYIKNEPNFECPVCKCNINNISTPAFELVCAKHLYEHHQIYCPNICYTCSGEKCRKVCFGFDHYKKHVKTCTNKFVKTREAKQLKNDPVLGPHLTFTESPVIVNIDRDSFSDIHFKCFKCSLNLNAKDIPERSPGRLNLIRFYHKCASHLYYSHGMACPNIIQRCHFPDCNVVVFSKTAIEAHLKNVHFKEKTKVSCNVCGTMILESSMRTHMLHKHSSNKFPCPTCGKIFNTEQGLSKHEKNYHLKSYIKCEHCTEVRKNLNSYVNHLYAKHGIVFEGYKIKECMQCDYKTLFKHSLVIHKRIHSQSFDYPCPTCNKKFKSNFNLQRHVQRIHQSKRWPCTECSQIFHSESGKNYHRWKVHHIGTNGGDVGHANYSMKKPFKCGYCQHTSGLQGNLKKHLLNVHKGLPIKFSDLRKEYSKELSCTDHNGV